MRYIVEDIKVLFFFVKSFKLSGEVSQRTCGGGVTLEPYMVNAGERSFLETRRPSSIPHDYIIIWDLVSDLETKNPSRKKGRGQRNQEEMVAKGPRSQ